MQPQVQGKYYACCARGPAKRQCNYVLYKPNIVLHPAPPFNTLPTFSPAIESPQRRGKKIRTASFCELPCVSWDFQCNIIYVLYRPISLFINTIKCTSRSILGIVTLRMDEIRLFYGSCQAPLASFFIDPQSKKLKCKPLGVGSWLLAGWFVVGR